jgi:recombination protein RecR
MSLYEGPVQSLIDELGRLPGIGPKSAQRIAFYILKAAPEDAKRLARSIVEAKDRVSWCRICFNIAEGEKCAFCRDERRDPTVICVVEEPRDIVSVERTGEFRGRYHVLQGAISPIEGVLPDQLRITELLNRIRDEEVKEVILATNPNVEGEATAMYLAQLLRPLDLRVTRIASGLPVGGDLEYADEVTLGRAFEGRRELSSLTPVAPVEETA